MSRKPLAAVLVLLSAALVLGGNALLDAGWGSALRSIADRVLPNPEITMWAPAPEPGSHASSYADATGAGANYVYLVDAADDRGNVRELQLIFFGRESNGVSVNLFFTSFAKQARRSRKGGFTGCANVFSPIPVTA